MIADSAGGARRDAVVVLARGESRRLGEPKPLALFGGDARPLLRRVVELYAATLAAPVVVITTGSLQAACAELVSDLPQVVVVGVPGGGDTARTLAEAWGVLRTAAEVPTHLWAHPVDLPLVAARTLHQLRRVSEAAPDRVVRPAWGAQPGHPLIMPIALLAALAAEAGAGSGPWRLVMEAAVAAGRATPPIVVAVADPGVVLDHDLRPTAP